MAVMESDAYALSESDQCHVVQEARAEVEHLIESLSLDRVLLPKGPEMRPVYLIVSSKINLTRKYGQPGFCQLDSDLRGLQEAITDHLGMQVILVYVDDLDSLSAFSLQPVNPMDPRQVKELIDHLDLCLNEQGREIRYLLIVGGDTVIPFHRLPNPIDDQDEDVPSDNPYASRDGNTLIPERVVGRLPDGSPNGGDEGFDFLHYLILRTADHHCQSSAKGLWSAIFGRRRPAQPAFSNGHSLGYSASIWRRASRAVFEVIGDDRQLRTSPPLAYRELGIRECPRFHYFNLHGVEDGANWYGQRDPLFPASYPLFPLALRPEDLAETEQADSIVFTEACYGANILGKDSRNSIALRFLDVQALAVVGSTKVAYGAIEPPLLGADLLGRYFWEGLRARMTVGEALRYAKVCMTRDVQKRQGYLDGEDQKTLMSFVLYGDPSLSVAAPPKTAKGAWERITCPPLVCRKARQHKALVSEELVATVKANVEAQLPYMAQAHVRAVPVALCTHCSNRCTPGRGNGRVAKAGPTNWALTLEKDISINGDTHHQVVRVTVDERGHILKLALSK